jgi:hypothetical protein
VHNLCRSMGTTETDFLGTIPQYHFAFFSPALDKAELVKFPLIPQVHAREEDIRFFRNRRPGDERSSAEPPPNDPPPPPPNEEKPGEPNIDELAVADAYAQLALAIRRGNTKRAQELQDHIAGLITRANEAAARDRRF